MPGGLCRALGDENLAGLGRLLDARGGVDRIAGRERLAGARVGDGHHRAGVDADAQLERDAVALAQLLVEVAEPPAHAQRGAQRARRVVLVHPRHAERRHDGVADELLDVPPSASISARIAAKNAPSTSFSRSASSRSPSSVDPVMSANRTVTTLRSSAVTGAVGVSCAPQPLQKRASSGFRARSARRSARRKRRGLSVAARGHPRF